MAATETSKRSGAVLELLRQRAGLSVRELADLMHVSHTTIYKRLGGEDWNMKERARLSDIFNVPESLFDMTVDDAARWLLEHNRFTVLDLREVATQAKRDPSCSRLFESFDLLVAAS